MKIFREDLKAAKLPPISSQPAEDEIERKEEQEEQEKQEDEIENNEEQIDKIDDTEKPVKPERKLTSFLNKFIPNKKVNTEGEEKESEDQSDEKNGIEEEVDNLEKDVKEVKEDIEQKTEKKVSFIGRFLRDSKDVPSETNDNEVKGKVCSFSTLLLSNNKSYSKLDQMLYLDRGVSGLKKLLSRKKQDKVDGVTEVQSIPQGKFSITKQIW